MSTVARVFSRSSLWARRATPRLPPRRILGRRGYASGHGEVKKTGDTPWILLAVGVTVPGVYLLWPPAPSHGSHGAYDAHGEEHKDHEEQEPAKDSESNEAQAAEEKKSDEGSSDSGSDSSLPPKGSENSSGEHDQSTESQSEKLTDKPASKRVDPTEK